MALPPKKAGIMVAIGVPKDGPPRLGTPGKAPMLRHDAEESPEMEQQEDSGSVPATPESVGYRTEAETCRNCEYMQGDQCAFLKIPVAEGDSCARFEGRAEDRSMGGEQMDREEALA